MIMVNKAKNLAPLANFLAAFGIQLLVSSG
jgi:hypothetical protein